VATEGGGNDLPDPVAGRPDRPGLGERPGPAAMKRLPAASSAAPDDDAPAQRRGWRVFVEEADQPRARRATDVILLFGSGLALALTSWAAIPQPGFARALTAFLASWPHFLDTLWQILADLSLLVALTIFVAGIATRFRSVGRDLLVGVILAIAVSLIVGRAVAGSWPDLWESLRRAEPPPWFPSSRVALPATIVFTASPHLTRPFRRLGWWAVLLGVSSTVLLGGTNPLGAVAGLLVALTAAALAHLLFGSSAGRPAVARVRIALAQRGIGVQSLGAADRQQAGLFVLQAEDESGQDLVVKVYGRDAHDAALLSTLWRTLWYREPGSPLRLGRLQQVEHEALLTLMASQAGVRTDTVITAGTTANNDALLVLRRVGTALAEPPTGAGDDLVSSIWALVFRLHRAGIAHGQIDIEHLVEVGDELGITDFRGATLAPSAAQRYTDQAQALVTTVLLAGTEPALRIAHARLGSDGLSAILPLLQPPVLTPSQRSQVKGRALDLDQLRVEAAAVADTNPPELQRLQRVSAGSIMRVILPAIALIALISAAGDLDWEQFWDQVTHATWWLVVLGLVAAQVPRVAQAVSTLGACPVPLPLGPAYALQLAISYINLAIPGTAARIAVNVRFFQRHGVQPGTAIAVGALDGFSGFIVEMVTLAVLLIFTSASLELELDSSTTNHAWRILIAVVIIAVVVIAVVASVSAWRRFILRWVTRLTSEARAALRGLQSPRRLGLLFGGNLATEILFPVALGIFTRAVGYPIGFGDLLFINISVSLLAGLLPIPGGIGVAEGALTFGLMRAGMSEEAAFAAALMYRLSNFYLPPIWGYFAFRWLQRSNHL
jgi:glycosyltransferase 2 family protein